MDKQDRYREIVLEVLRSKEWDYDHDELVMKARLVADKEADKYLVQTTGWKGREYIYATRYQLDIINGKIWFQVNNTEEEIVDELMAAGVPASDIVLGFIPEKARIATGFATA